MKNKLVEVEITQMSKKGNGLGFFEHPQGQKQVEVPFTAIGDSVKATVLCKRGKVYKAKLEEVTKPSSDRIAPRCVHFGVCGGCRFQHISYESQKNWKENYVKECFAKILNDKIKFYPLHPCKQIWNYRNKMEYTFSKDSLGKKYLGLMMDSSKGKVLNLTECHLVNPWFVDAIKVVHHWWNETGLDAYHMRNDSGALRTLMLREGMRTGDRMVVLTVSGNPQYPLSKKHLETFVATLRDAIEPLTGGKLSIFLRIQQIGKGMSTNFYEMHLYGADHIKEILKVQLRDNEQPLELTFQISPAAFFQTNTYQAEQLYMQALKMANIPEDGVVYDLYCGTGTLGICVSKYVKQVIGVEVSPESALDAQLNAKNNNCGNVSIVSGAVRHMLSQIHETKSIPAPDLIIVNPPRPGLDPHAIEHLRELNAKKILYISCNPQTQMENVEKILEHGYEVVSIQPVDQFPHTYHIENIVFLEKKEG